MFFAVISHGGNFGGIVFLNLASISGGVIIREKQDFGFVCKLKAL